MDIRIEALESQGWRFIPDPSTWTGGVWIHDVLGTANRGGGTWPTMAQALESAERLIEALERMRQ